MYLPDPSVPYILCSVPLHRAEQFFTRRVDITFMALLVVSTGCLAHITQVRRDAEGMM
jgi:hypothetical protein